MEKDFDSQRKSINIFTLSKAGLLEMKTGERTFTNLRHDCWCVDAVIVLPSIQAALCCHGWPVNISGQQVPLGITLHVCEFVSGAEAALRCAAAAPLFQRDAAVLPHGRQVGLGGDAAVVLRRSGQKNHRQRGVTAGDGPQAQKVKHLLLKTAPFSEEGGGRVVVRHVGRGWVHRVDAVRTGFTVGISKALAISHPPIPLLKGQSDKKMGDYLLSLVFFLLFFNITSNKDSAF